MANDPKGEQAGAPALGSVKTEREAEAVVRAREAGRESGGAPVQPSSGDSPKPHGDKMEHADDSATDAVGGGG